MGRASRTRSGTRNGAMPCGRQSGGGLREQLSGGVSLARTRCCLVAAVMVVVGRMVSRRRRRQGLIVCRRVLHRRTQGSRMVFVTIVGFPQLRLREGLMLRRVLTLVPRRRWGFKPEAKYWLGLCTLVTILM